MTETFLRGVEQPKEEETPFLGWPPCLDAPGLFQPQLREILRAALYGKLRIMLPTSVGDVGLRAAEGILEECREELESEGTEYGEVEVGMMVETPAAILARSIAPEVSFFSFGTNGLVRYMLADDRGDERLRRLQGADRPVDGQACESVRRRGSGPVCAEKRLGSRT